MEPELVVVGFEAARIKGGTVLTAITPGVRGLLDPTPQILLFGAIEGQPLCLAGWAGQLEARSKTTQDRLSCCCV